MTASNAVVLAGFQAVELQPAVKQEVLLSYTAWLLATARCAQAGASSAREAATILEQAQAEVLRYGVGPRHITSRQFNALPHQDAELGVTGELPVLPRGFEDIAEHPGGPSLERRMRDFERLALRALDCWYRGKDDAPDHLIHVCCSGYASPSPAQRLVSQRGWTSTPVTHSYHMDCYGAFPAIRTATALLAPSVLSLPEPPRRIDVIHTEYLSAHICTSREGPGPIIDATLFADGFIGYSAYPEVAFARAEQRGLRVLAHHEQLIPGSLSEMTWGLGPRHFEMQLSKNVPLLIRDALPAFVEQLCARARLDFAREKGRMAFAIHPGGPKILDHAAEVLGLDGAQMQHSRQVFRQHGNMSSATVPHILMRQLADPAIEHGTRLLAVAFGPGLTATGMVFEKVCTDGERSRLHG